MGLQPGKHVRLQGWQFYFFGNHSAHPVHDHSPALDSGFRRNDVSYHAVFKSVIPAKAGAFGYPGLFLDLLSNYFF
jgi:hypothetical protein